MRIVPGFVVREVAGETIAIPTGDAARELSGLIALNGCGKFLFELLQEDISEESLVDALLRSYEIDSDTAKNDVSEFLESLRKGNVLIEN